MFLLKQVNASLGFWLDVRGAVNVDTGKMRRGYVWRCGCSGTSDDGDHVDMVPCEQHVGEILGPVEDGVPDQVKEAAIRALGNVQKKPQGEAG